MSKLIYSSTSESCFNIQKKNYEKLMNRVFSLLPSKSQTVELLLVDSSQMKKLNYQFRGKNRPTDVLSFESDQRDLLGSIVIDLETAKDQAKDYRHSHAQEVRELFLHGLLHLLGMDHENAADAYMMKSYEEYFLSQKSAGAS